MSNAEQIRDRMWAISAAIVGGWYAYLFFFSHMVALHSPGMTHVLQAISVGFGLVAMVPAAGCIALFRGASWGRTALKHSAVAGIVLLSLGTLALSFISNVNYGAHTGWTQAEWDEEQRYRIFSLCRIFLAGAARIVYFRLLYLRMAAKPEETPADDSDTETTDSQADAAAHARKLYWAVSALLVGLWYISDLASTSESFTSRHEGGKEISIPAFGYELQNEYNLLRYCLDLPHNHFTLALQIKLIVFTLIRLSGGPIGIALITGSIGVIKRKAWARLLLIDACLAGFIVSFPSLNLRQSLAHDLELVSAYARMPELVQNILRPHSAFNLNTALWDGLWVIYFALLFRQMAAKAGEIPANTDSTAR